MKQSRRVTKLLWEQWQLEIIRDFASKVSIQELAAKVKKTPLATAKKAQKLGFSIAHKDNEAIYGTKS